MSKSSIDRPAGESASFWEGHRERLRQRMEREGWDALKPHEMVELVLYHAVPRQDFAGLARALVERFGSLGGVFEAPRERLAEVPGMTPATVEWVALTGELMRAYYYEAMEGEALRLSRWAEARAFLAPLSRATGPSTWVLYIDFEFNLITFSALPAEPWWDAENARLMIRHAASTGARYAIIARFVGDAALEIDDAELARLQAIAVTMRAVDVEILDFALAGARGFCSLNRSGRMDVVRLESRNLSLHERYAEGD